MQTFVRQNAKPLIEHIADNNYRLVDCMKMVSERACSPSDFYTKYISQLILESFIKNIQKLTTERNIKDEKEKLDVFEDLPEIMKYTEKLQRNGSPLKERQSDIQLQFEVTYLSLVAQLLREMSGKSKVEQFFIIILSNLSLLSRQKKDCYQSD